MSILPVCCGAAVMGEGLARTERQQTLCCGEKEQFMERALTESRIIAIIRGVSPDRILDTARALYAGGIRFIEMTFPQGGDTDGVCRSIRDVAVNLGDRVFVGAGTVLTREQVRAARDSGAEYIISPVVDEAVIEETLKLGMLSIPGAMTPTEIYAAYRAGANFVKVFPASVLGPDYFKAVKAPLPGIPLIAVGGIDENNAAVFLNAGACALGIGGRLIDKKAVEAGDYAAVTRAARRIAEAVK